MRPKPTRERERISMVLEKECLLHPVEMFYQEEELKGEKDCLFQMKFQRSNISPTVFYLFEIFAL